MNTSTKLPVLFLLMILLSSSPLFATKLVTYTHRGETRLGAWVQAGVVDLNRAYATLLKDRGKTRVRARADALVPPDMLEFLQGEEDSMKAGLTGLAHVNGVLGDPSSRKKLMGEGVLFAHDEVHMEAPLPNTPHLLSLRLNYREHIAEMNAELPQHLVIFTKEGSVIGPDAAIMIPPIVTEPDYEVELAFVIGRRAWQVSEEDALDHVAGYTTFNDVSARHVQMRVSQWTLGKSVDTFTAMGPYLVLTDEIPDPQTLRITTRIGDELLQDSNTRDMVFNVAQIIARLSQIIALEPGTVITTGSPSGVGVAREPQRFLRDGETVTVEVEKLGALSNPVVQLK